MNAIELFAGAGGLAIGASRAGFKHAAILEWNSDACETIRTNCNRPSGAECRWPEVLEMDVREFSYRQFADRIDMVAGGPPCQPFSLGGRHQAFLDPRDMWPQAARAIREVRPRAFVFENVRGLTRRSFATYFEYVLLSLSHPMIEPRLGEEWISHRDRLERHHTAGRARDPEYQVLFQVVNAADYGIPQRRSRVFIVGFRKDIGASWSFPAPTHCEEALLWDQWGSGNYWERNGVSKGQRPQPSESSQRRAGRFQLFKSRGSVGKPWRTVREAIADLPEPRVGREHPRIHNHVLNPGARSYDGHTGSALDSPAKALKAGVHGVPGGENMMVLPSGEVRYFTTREAARLQTFPDQWVFSGAWSEAMRQLGNAVPVDLASTVIGSVAESLMKTVHGRAR